MPQRKKKVRSDDVSKMFMVYKCTNETCGKRWNSFHGWKAVSSNDEKCEKCKNGRGKSTNIVERMADLECYFCSVCNERWSYLKIEDEHERQLKHPPRLVCSNGCGLAFGVLAGIQTRHCKVISFECNKKACGDKWDSPYFGKEYSQKCRKCNYIGKIIGTERKNPEEETEGSKGRFGGPGRHNVEGCDMCLELKAFGLNCTTLHKVKVEEFLAADGRFKVSLSATYFGRGAGPSNRQ